MPPGNFWMEIHPAVEGSQCPARHLQVGAGAPPSPLVRTPGCSRGAVRGEPSHSVVGNRDEQEGQKGKRCPRGCWRDGGRTNRRVLGSEAARSFPSRSCQQRAGGGVEAALRLRRSGVCLRVYSAGLLFHLLLFGLF